VRVQRPAEALGTILHDTRVDALPPAGADAMTPYQRKVAALTTPALVQRLYPRDAETIVLTEEQPGLYTGSIANTSTPGLYAFEAVLDWNDPRTGRVHRVERLEKHVKVTPDAGQTAIVTTRAADGVLVAVTPRDRFGNYVGPGYESSITATLNGAGTITSTPVDADQTGTYTFTVTGVPAGETPDIDITVDGVAVGGTSSSAASGKWRVFIDSGKTITHGGRREFRDGVFSVNAGLERLVTQNVSLEAILGYHRFKNPIGDPVMWQFSLGGKYWFGSAAAQFRPFLDASIGAYYLHPAKNTRFGASAGGGVLYRLTPNLGLEGVYHFTNVNTEHDSVSFSSVQGGVRWWW
jgi:opacity protein-like surface antigen